MPLLNRGDLPPDPDKSLLTFGADVQLRSEAEWPSGDICGDSQQHTLLGTLGRPLGPFVTHPRSWWKDEAKVMDPQQSSPLCGRWQGAY